MTDRLKNRPGGYSLRGPGVKKHLSEDFEYNLSRFSAAASTTLRKQVVGPNFKNNSVKRLKSRSQKVQIAADVNSAASQSPRKPQLGCGVNQVNCMDQNDIPQETKALGVARESLHEATLRVHKQTKQDFLIPNDDNDNNNGEDGQEDSRILEQQYFIAGNGEDGNVIVLDGGNVLIENDRISNESEQLTEVNEFSDSVCDFLPQLRPQDRIECAACHKLLKPGSYRQHLRTHSGAKPFSCEQCVATFTRKGDVERHVRIVHNKQKPFQCPHCVRAFGDKKNLRWHLENHDRRLFYICAVCGFKFGKREYYENHVRFLHPEEALTQDVRSDENENKDSVSIGELGYLMLVPTGNGDELTCLKVPSDNDSQFSNKFLETAEPDNVGAFVIQFSEDGANSEIFSSDILSNGCEPVSSEILRVKTEDSEEKSDGKDIWGQSFYQLQEKRGSQINEESAQVIELVLDNPGHHQPVLQCMNECDDLQFLQLINNDIEEVEY